MPQAYKLANIWVKGKYPHCSYTALESMNKQANCKATANPIFDQILAQHNKKFDRHKNNTMN